MLINAEDFQAIVISVNTDANTELQKIYEEAKKEGIVDIYNSKYVQRLNELSNFLNVTHVLNGVIQRYKEVMELANEPVKEEM